MKIVILIFLLVIFYCLGSGVFYLVRGQAGSTKLAKMLTWRIVLSFVLFLFLFVAYFLGWLHPNKVEWSFSVL